MMTKYIKLFEIGHKYRYAFSSSRSSRLGDVHLRRAKSYFRLFGMECRWGVPCY